MKKIDPTELGATLFIPALHKDLLAVAEGKKYPNLKSVLIDSEDGIDESDLADAITKIKELLIKLKKGSCLVFIRPRDVEVLKEFLTFDGIEKIDGFILPKFSLENADEYLRVLGNSYAFMPSIEGEELFNHAKLIQLRDILLLSFEQIITIRFGLEDMLRQLRIGRKCNDSVFDFSATSAVLGNFIATFKSAGFNVSGGVYPCFKEMDWFKLDVLRDLKEGLFSKTIIHPNQIDIVNELYKVSAKEFEEALEICESSKSLFNQDGKMAEVTTMKPRAQETIKRAEIYGIYKNRQY